METMTFGKHEGEPSSDVPVGYLIWAAAAMETPPECVVNELRRRAGQFGSRSAIEAGAALAGLMFRQHKSQRKRHRKVLARERASRRQSIKARCKLESYAEGVWMVGEHYNAARETWLASGGDPQSCPFDVPESNSGAASEPTYYGRCSLSDIAKAGLHQ
jgi:hypothetical protein